MQQSLYCNCTKCQANSACPSHFFSIAHFLAFAWSRKLLERQAFEHLSSPHGVKRSSLLYMRTWQLQKYIDFHDFTFFCLKQMRETEQVRRSELAWHLVQLRYNDCCIIKLLFKGRFHAHFLRPLSRPRWRRRPTAFFVFSRAITYVIAL
jgi:hypothetical protein